MLVVRQYSFSSGPSKPNTNVSFGHFSVKSVNINASKWLVRLNNEIKMSNMVYSERLYLAGNIACESTQLNDFTCPYLPQADTYHSTGGHWFPVPIVNASEFIRSSGTSLFYCMRYLKTVPKKIYERIKNKGQRTENTATCRCCKSRLSNVRQFIKPCSLTNCRNKIDFTACQQSCVDLLNVLAAQDKTKTVHVVLLRGVAGTGKTTLVKYIATHLTPGAYCAWMAIKHILLIGNTKNIAAADFQYNSNENSKQRNNCASTIFMTIAKFLNFMDLNKELDNLQTADKLMYEDVIKIVQEKLLSRLWFWSQIRKNQTHLIIVDEVSMVPNIDIVFMLACIQAVARIKECKFIILLVGDPLQMSPINSRGMERLTELESQARAEKIQQSLMQENNVEFEKLKFTSDLMTNVQLVLRPSQEIVDTLTVREKTLTTVVRADRNDVLMHAFLGNYTDSENRKFLILNFLKSANIPNVQPNADDENFTIDVRSFFDSYYNFIDMLWKLNDRSFYITNNEQQQQNNVDKLMFNPYTLSPDFFQIKVPFTLAVKRNFECYRLWREFFISLCAYLVERVRSRKQSDGTEISYESFRRFVAPYRSNSQCESSFIVVGLEYKVHASPMDANSSTAADNVYVVGKTYVVENILYDNADKCTELGTGQNIIGLAVFDPITYQRSIMYPVVFMDRRNPSCSQISPTVGFPIYPSFIENTYQLQGATLDTDLYIDASGFTTESEMYVCLSRVLHSAQIKKIINYY